MQQETLFILPGTDLMNRLTSINGGVDTDKLTPSIWMAQITDIKRVLGDRLYQKIYDDFKPYTLSGVYKTIYENYVVNMLVMYATSDFINRHALYIGNGGIYKTTPDNTSAPDYKEIDRLSNYYKNQGAHFELKFYDFMKTNDVPEYDRKNNDDNTFKFGWQI